MEAFFQLVHAGRNLMVQAQNAALPLVPEPGLAGKIAIPGPHLAGGQRQAASLLAGAKLFSGGVQRLGALIHPVFQLLVELMQLARLAEQFGENPDLGAQQFRHHRHRQIIHRAGLIAAQEIGFRHMDGGNENDRGLLETRMFADHLRQFEAVKLGHADIHQDDGDIRLEQICQGFLGGGHRDKIFPQLLQHHLVAHQLAGLVIDQQNVDGLVFRHFIPQRWSHMRSADKSCSVLTGLAR